MNPVELAAAALGLVNVALVARRSLWNYPFGIAMVALYFFVFADAKLYSDALLQIFFLVIQLYGWWNWSRSARVDDGVAVGRLDYPARIGWIVGTALARELTGDASRGPRGRRLRFPVFGSRAPGSLELTGADLSRAEWEEDLRRHGLSR